MILHRLFRLGVLLLLLLVISSVIYAFAANISMPIVRLTDQSSAITADTLKPPACAGITVSVIVYCPPTGGNCDGTNANELMIGSPNIDVIQGRGGSDCILGGDGDDDITGSQATDICIGGPGTDIFKKCETVNQ
jgi:hypothetical protein